MVTKELNKALEAISIPYELRQYQKEGVFFLATSDSAILADEMGLGKTVQTIVAARLVVAKDVTARILVVVPNALQQNWYDEFRLWAPDLSVRVVKGNRNNRIACYLLPIPVIIATYEQIRSDIDEFDYNDKFEIVILDEAQRIKNSNSRTNITCTTLPRNRSWALSGTPLENHPNDFISISSFVRPGMLSQGMNSETVQSLIAPHFFRRTKKQALPDLPPIIYQDLRLELSGTQLFNYENLWSERRSITETMGGPIQTEMLALITKLKLQCNYDVASNESAKLEALKIILENLENCNDKILIFSQYVESLKWLSRQIRGLPTAIYHGSLNQEQRQSVINDFQTMDGPRALLMSIKAGGVGLNLPQASTVVLFDRWWNPAVENQAIQRAHRFGRPDPLHVVRFIVKDTIEERIEEILHRKSDLFETYVENAKNADIGLIPGEKLRLLLS